MSQERIEAAAVTLCEQLWENAHESQKEYALEEATEALAAADAVMFSDEAIERAAEAVGNEYEPWAESSDVWREVCRNDVRTIIKALKGDA